MTMGKARLMNVTMNESPFFGRRGTVGLSRERTR